MPPLLEAASGNRLLVEKDDSDDDGEEGQYVIRTEALEEQCQACNLVLLLAEATGAGKYTFPQCALGAAAQKYTTLLGPRSMAAQLAPFRRLQCTHRCGHSAVAFGYDVDGSSRSDRFAAYPARLNELIASCLVDAARARSRLTTRDAGGGGRVADGAKLCPAVSAACEAAACEPPGFASARSRQHIPPSQLEATRMPPRRREPTCQLLHLGTLCSHVRIHPWVAQPPPRFEALWWQRSGDGTLRACCRAVRADDRALGTSASAAACALGTSASAAACADVPSSRHLRIGRRLC